MVEVENENNRNSGGHRKNSSSIQKHKNNVFESKNRKTLSRNRPKKEADNGKYAGFHAYIFIRVTDRRRRDIDGMVSTIFDVIVNAGVLDDDSIEQIASISAKVVRASKGQEGFDVILVGDNE